MYTYLIQFDHIKTLHLHWVLLKIADHVTSTHHLAGLFHEIQFLQFQKKHSETKILDKR